MLTDDVLKKVEETKPSRLAKFWIVRPRDLYEFYDFFADRSHQLGDGSPDGRQLLRVADERMDAIQRELDRRSQRMSTLVGFAALILTGWPILIGMVQCQTNKLPAKLPMKLPNTEQSMPNKP